MFQQRQFRERRKLGEADGLAKLTHSDRGIAPAADTADGWHPRVVPARHQPILDQFKELALAQDSVGQVKARKFALIRAAGQAFDMLD